MDLTGLADRADRLRALHLPGQPLVLPNAWDAVTASAVVAAGFPAVASTSAGVAHSLGYEDGEALPAGLMFEALARMARAVDVPLTADIESGYGLPPAEVAARLLESGAVGCNLEDSDHAGDGLRPLAEQSDRIAAVKDEARRLGVDVVVNARVDVFVRGVGEPTERVELAVERAEAYRRAGADCVYPILASEDELAGFLARHDGPVNAMAVGEWVRLSRLVSSGVARISFGSLLQRELTEELRRRLEMISRGDDGWATA